MKLFKSLKKTMISLIAGVTVFTAAAAGIGGLSVQEVSADTLPQQTDSNLNLDVKGAIAVDAKTGQILYAKNAEQALPVASMSKLMTIYLVLQAVKNGKLSWDQKILPDESAQKVSQDTSFSNVPLKADQKYTVKSLYQATLIYSANGAAMALAGAVGGTQKNFIDMMRREALKMGIKDAEIYTASGLANDEVFDAKYPGADDKAENKLSAKDMAIIARRLIADYPEVLDTTKITRMKFDNGTDQTEMENWNWMLPGLAKAYSALPVDGLKTGTSDAAGACFTGTVNKDGHRLITVVLGARHDGQEDLSRFVETQKLMSYCYNNYTYTTLKSGKTFKKADTLPVHNGKDLNVGVVSQDSSDVWLKSGVTSSSFTATLKGNRKLYEKDGLAAPLKKNQTVGTLSVKVKGQELHYLDGSTSIALKAGTKKSVDKANIFVIAWRAVRGLFSK